MSEPERKILQEEDWGNTWKEHFHPTRIGRRFVIKPSWHTYDPGANDLVIELDPGMAFGTGLHPTTRMMLEAIEEAIAPTLEASSPEACPNMHPLGVRHGRPSDEESGNEDAGEHWGVPAAAGTRVFDIGTGSGILAIAAVLLGAISVDAVDVESVACRVAGENTALNGVDDRVTISRGSIERATGKYEVILANIVSSVLVEIAPAFPPLMHPDSRVFISGVIEPHADEVNDAFARAGMEVVSVTRSGDWLCEELRRSRK